MDVAPHRLGQPVQAADQRIGLILDQPGLAAQSVERGVEQREPLGIVGQDDTAREVDEGAGHGEAGHAGRRGVIGDRAEQIGGLLADLPHDLVGRYAVSDQPARGDAPRVEVVGGGKGYDAHGLVGWPKSIPPQGEGTMRSMMEVSRSR